MWIEKCRTKILISLSAPTVRKLKIFKKKTKGESADLEPIAPSQDLFDKLI
jgi:hypothetical protein